MEENKPKKKYFLWNHALLFQSHFSHKVAFMMGLSNHYLSLIISFVCETQTNRRTDGHFFFFFHIVYMSMPF